MQPWAVIAEWVRGSTALPSWSALESRTHRQRTGGIHRLPRGLSVSKEEICDGFVPSWFRLLVDKSLRKQSRKLRRRSINNYESLNDGCLSPRQQYRDTVDRGLRLGLEISLEDESDLDKDRNVTVSYQSVPLRHRELMVNSKQEQTVRIAWSSEHKGDTALVEYNYNSFIGHAATWLVSGSGGPISITSRDFEQENDVKLRSNIQSHPLETDLNGSIRINYLTDNVNFRWKAALKYPFLKRSIRISHGVEANELFGCCWTLKAEKTSEELPWRAVRMETMGGVTDTGASRPIDHLKAQLIRHLIGSYDAEIEAFDYVCSCLFFPQAKTPFMHRGVKWTTKLSHKNDRGTECTTAVDGEDRHFASVHPFIVEWLSLRNVRAVSVRCSHKPVKDAGLSIAGCFRPEEGWSASTSLKLGPQDSNDDQRWNVKTELDIIDGFRCRQANIDLFVPI